MTPQVPEFINPDDISAYDDEKMEAHLEGIRERRLIAYQQYKVAQEEKRRISDEKIAAKMAKQLDMLAKNLATLDKSIATVEKRVNTVRALKLELGLDI